MNPFGQGAGYGSLGILLDSFMNGAMARQASERDYQQQQIENDYRQQQLQFQRDQQNRLAEAEFNDTLNALPAELRPVVFNRLVSGYNGDHTKVQNAIADVAPDWYKQNERKEFNVGQFGKWSGQSQNEARTLGLDPFASDYDTKLAAAMKPTDQTVPLMGLGAVPMFANVSKPGFTPKTPQEIDDERQAEQLRLKKEGDRVRLLESVGKGIIPSATADDYWMRVYGELPPVWGKTQGLGATTVAGNAYKDAQTAAVKAKIETDKKKLDIALKDMQSRVDRRTFQNTNDANRTTIMQQQANAATSNAATNANRLTWSKQLGRQEIAQKAQSGALDIAVELRRLGQAKANAMKYDTDGTTVIPDEEMQNYYQGQIDKLTEMQNGGTTGGTPMADYLRFAVGKGVPMKQAIAKAKQRFGANHDFVSIWRNVGGK